MRIVYSTQEEYVENCDFFKCFIKFVRSICHPIYLLNKNIFYVDSEFFVSESYYTGSLYVYKKHFYPLRFFSIQHVM